MKLVFFFIFLLFCNYSFEQVIVTIKSPANYALSPDVLSISASVTSPNEITSVTASIRTLQINLVYNPTDKYFEGKMSLTSFKEGDTLALAVSASDFSNSYDTATEFIVYDNPPKISIAEPLDNFVADPKVHFSLNNIDIDTCILNIYAGTYPYMIGNPTDTTRIYTASVKDFISGDLDLSSYADHDLLFEVIDKKNQITAKWIYINFISSTNSPGLTRIYKGNSYILSLYKKNLFTVGDSLLHPRLINFLTNIQTVIPFTQPLKGKAFVVENNGAVFTAGGALYEWYNNTLDSIGITQGAFEAAGNYVSWNNNKNLYVRNLASASTTLIATNSGNVSNDVAANGAVAFWDDNYNIHLYKNGLTTTLSNNDNNKWNIYPVTDGNYVVYRKTDPCCQVPDVSLYLNDGAQNIELTDLGMGSSLYNLAYTKVNNKFVAYCAFDLIKNTQIWLRDSLGHSTQVTHFASSCTIENLDDAGDIMFISDGKRYFAPRNGDIRFISSAIGQAYSVDSTWYVSIDNALFKLNNNIVLPLDLIGFSASSQGKVVELHWQVPAGKNTDRFEIERQEPGRPNMFNSIGEVMASSDDAGSHQYSFIDSLPLQGINLYRLKSFDKDGIFVYSTIVSANMQAATTMNIYPNPVTNSLNIQLTNGFYGHVTCIIADATGNKMLKLNQVISEAGTITVDVSKLHAGLYLLSIYVGNNKLTTQKFIKL